MEVQNTILVAGSNRGGGLKVYTAPRATCVCWAGFRRVGPTPTRVTQMALPPPPALLFAFLLPGSCFGAAGQGRPEPPSSQKQPPRALHILLIGASSRDSGWSVTGFSGTASAAHPHNAEIPDGPAVSRYHPPSPSTPGLGPARGTWVCI